MIDNLKWRLRQYRLARRIDRLERRIHRAARRAAA